MIISVHIPKTAGTSFGRGLSAAYGGRVLMDYHKDKAYSWMFRHKVRRWKSRCRAWLGRKRIEQRYDVIHGHFAADKYDFLSRVRYATFLRHPVYQAASHYAHHVRKRESDSEFHREICEKGMSFAEYVRFVGARPFYATYLSGKDPRSFDFVGVTESYDDSIELFDRVFGVSIDRYQVNRNKDCQYEAMIREAGGVELLETALADNMKIYARGRERFEELRRSLL